MTHSIRGDKSICLPVSSEAEYKAIIADNNTFREYILQTSEKYPEIFPLEMKKGFSFHDWVKSSKQQLPMRRIKLKENEYLLMVWMPMAATIWLTRLGFLYLFSPWEVEGISLLPLSLFKLLPKRWC